MSRQSHNHPPHEPICREHVVGACMIVIDPEDDNDVAALCDAYLSVDHRVGTSPMQAALRSLIAPPKPDEPTGLGAVVEDADGVRHVRVFVGEQSAWLGFICDEGGERKRPYNQIAAVRVLSVGVTA